MNYLVNDNGKMSLYSENVFPIVHCAKPTLHQKKSMCGKKIPLWRRLSRHEFKLFPTNKKCRSCARTRYARFI